MTNKELQGFLNNHSDETEIRIYLNGESIGSSLDVIRIDYRDGTIELEPNMEDLDLVQKDEYDSELE